MDSDGYPEEEELQTIREWPYELGFHDLMAYVKERWWSANWGWTTYQDGDKTHHLISTGGWSGNEEIVSALKNNRMFWMINWKMSRSGGHYQFIVADLK